MSATMNTDNTVTLEIAGTDVTLPLKFAPGHVLTDAQAKILDAAFQRQFTNNQNAGHTARQKKLAEATTDAEKAAAQEAIAKFNAEHLASLYADYTPAVGGTRIGSMDKIRNDAAWRFWTARAKAHNDNLFAHTADGKVSDDYVPVHAKAGKSMIPALTTKKGPDGKVLPGGSIPEQRDSFVARLLAMPDFADEIQANVDAILAENGKAKAAAPAGTEATVSTEDLL